MASTVGTAQVKASRTVNVDTLTGPQRKSTTMTDPDDIPEVTGRRQLGDALARPDQFSRQRTTWQALTLLEDQVTATVLRDVLPRLPLSEDLTAAERERVHATVRGTAIDLVWAYKLTLAGSKNTLAALAKGTPSPVHGADRDALCTSVRRKLTAAGYLTPTQASARTLTYELADLFAAALASTYPAPTPDPRTHRPDATCDVEDDADAPQDLAA